VLLRSAAAIGTGISLLASGGALADSNFLNIVQDGNTNQGSVVQTGQGNTAGTATLPVHQTGIFDSLTVIQSGDGNTLGLDGQGAVQFGTASTDGSAANSATIIQNSNGNRIGELVQSTGAVHASTANTLTVTQDIGNDNVIGSIQQIEASGASGNLATVVQTGAHNWLDQLVQQSTSTEGLNRILFKATGNYNGTDLGPATGPGTLAIVARSTGATASRIIQGSDLSGGANNDAALIITGLYNEFGIEQLGIDNSVGSTITGLGNSFASYQQGEHNQISSGNIAGDGNDMGLRQVGGENAISANLQWSSGYNEVGVGQDGESNTADLVLKGDHGIFGVSQLGRENKATLTSTGNGNIIVAIAANDGALTDRGNDLQVSINGDGNNGLLGGSPQSFTGPALLVADAAPAIAGSLLLAPDAGLMLGPHHDSAGLMPGLLIQWGDGDSMTITVGASRASSNNLFTAAQVGNGNLLTAAIDGNENQLAVLQFGNGNTAASEIDGTHNITAISQ